MTSFSHRIHVSCICLKFITLDINYIHVGKHTIYIYIYIYIYMYIQWALLLGKSLCQNVEPLRDQPDLPTNVVHQKRVPESYRLGSRGPLKAKLKVVFGWTWNPKADQSLNGCFNWMSPNHYHKKWLEITKHPFINGWPWGSRDRWSGFYCGLARMAFKAWDGDKSSSLEVISTIKI